MTSPKASVTRNGDLSIVAAGVEWDAVKVPRYAGLRALTLLEDPGLIVVDPAPAAPALYFLVPPQSTTGWDVPQTTALSTTAHVVMPPPLREAPPGPYWLLAPGHSPQWTDTDTLRRALLEVLGTRGDVQLPDVSQLTVDQLRGLQCALCRAQLTGEPRSLGTIPTGSGAHRRDTELWACLPDCTTT